MGLDEVDYGKPVLISSLDQLVSINIDQAINYFVNVNCDGGLVTFNSRNPRWSYAMITNNKVQQTAEKNQLAIMQ